MVMVAICDDETKIGAELERDLLVIFRGLQNQQANIKAHMRGKSHASSYGLLLC